MQKLKNTINVVISLILIAFIATSLFRIAVFYLQGTTVQ